MLSLESDILPETITLEDDDTVVCWFTQLFWSAGRVQNNIVSLRKIHTASIG